MRSIDTGLMDGRSLLTVAVPFMVIQSVFQVNGRLAGPDGESIETLADLADLGWSRKSRHEHGSDNGRGIRVTFD